MTAHNLISGEGPRARVVLDRLAKAAGLSSGQALLCHLEGLDAAGIAVIAEAVDATVPVPPAVDELAEAAA